MLRKRIIREFGEIEYIQTWERHQSGFPHVHLAIHSESIQEACTHRKRSNDDDVFGYLNFVDVLQRHAVECHFGPRGWLEPLKNKKAMAGYMVKLARELTGAKGKSQIPINAPPHFRRIRASRKLLPPVHRDPDITGVLRFCKLPET
jgi:hypothetical protein